MKRGSLFWMFVLMVCIFSTTVAMAADRVPLRVARVPIVLQGGRIPEDETIDALETRLDRALHVPLNQTLHAVEYLPEAECERVLRAVWEERKKTNGRASLEEVMQIWAETLEADIAVCPVLTEYDEYSYFGWSWRRGTFLSSRARIVLYGYDRSSGKPFQKSWGRNYHGESSTQGSASVLALECMDKVIADAGLREMISRWKR